LSNTTAKLFLKPFTKLLQAIYVRTNQSKHRWFNE